MTNELLELIRFMNQKPIAFNKHYVDLGCGINGALMLSQLVYWADKAKDPNGWIYKTGKEWTEETGLNRREQDTARKNLRELGLIEEHKHGVPCKIHYKVSQDTLYSKLLEAAQIRQTECTERTNCMHKSAKLNAQNVQTNTESTAENTAEITTHLKDIRVIEIFEFWKSVFKKTDRMKLDGLRERKIKARLNDGISKEDIMKAITNVSQDWWHVDNNHIDLELICRNDVKMQQFINMKPKSKAERENKNRYAPKPAEPNTMDSLRQLAEEYENGKEFSFFK